MCGEKLPADGRAAGSPKKRKGLIKVKKTLAGAAEKIIWAAYAGAYDDLARHYKPYKDLNLFILAKLKECSVKNKKLFDAGCGTGELALSAAQAGFEVTAADNCAAMLKIFSAKAKKKGINAKIIHADINSINGPELGLFGAVTCVHTLFAAEDKKKCLKKLAGFTAPGGRLIIAHNRPADFRELYRLEVAENGRIGALKSFFGLFRVGVINLMLSAFHKKVYGIMQPGEVAEILFENGFSQVSSDVMYRGMDDVMVFIKENVT